MMKTLIIQSAAAILLLPGCSVMRNKHSEKADSLSRRELNKTIRSSFHSSSRANRVLVVNDSMGHRYSAEIFPMGGFHYSPSEGFTGEASRIVVKEEIKRGITINDSVAGGSSLNGQQTLSLKEKELSKTSSADKEKEVQRSGTARLFWLLLLVAGVVGGGALWWRKADKLPPSTA